MPAISSRHGKLEYLARPIQSEPSEVRVGPTPRRNLLGEGDDVGLPALGRASFDTQLVRGAGVILALTAAVLGVDVTLCIRQTWEILRHDRLDPSEGFRLNLVFGQVSPTEST
ncbi:MAG TPA: hypothetical protein VJK02_00005, partial [Anaerolineales bacterium]|nr:hypothetical protein [Anaerolineales bacterium]